MAAFSAAILILYQLFIQNRQVNNIKNTIIIYNESITTIFRFLFYLVNNLDYNFLIKKH